MHPLNILLVTLGASLAASFSDWFFMGVLFHDKYGAAPEMWRDSASRSEPRFIFISQILGLVSCVAIVLIRLHMHKLGWAPSLGVAGLVWFAGPAVILGQMALWTRMHPLTALAHALGWLTRYLLTMAMAVAWV